MAMVYCCVPLCKSRSGKTPGVSFHQFPVDEELCAKWRKHISRENLVINDKSASTVVCSKHFLLSDYVSECKIKRLVPGAVPTVFEGYPSYLAPSAKKPRRNPKARDPIPPRKPAKRKAEPEEYAVLESPEGESKQKASTCTQTTHNDAQRASRYLSLVARLRSQVAYHRSKFSKAQQQLEAERKVISSYRDDKHYASVKNIAADAEKGEKRLFSCFTK